MRETASELLSEPNVYARNITLIHAASDGTRLCRLLYI